MSKTKGINVNEFKRKTIEGLHKNLAHSKDLLERFDPDYQDVAGRKASMAFLKELNQYVSEFMDIYDGL